MTIVHELFQVDKLGMVVHETLLPGGGEVAIIVDAALHFPPPPPTSSGGREKTAP